jgi:hypothetical protein
MGDYRDGADALRERARVLEEELAERDRQIAERDRQLAERDRQNAEQRAELDALRREAEQSREAPPAGSDRTCSKCGKLNEPHYQFCLGCGDDLDPRDVSPLAAAPGGQVAIAAGLMVAFLLAASAVMVAIVLR